MADSGGRAQGDAAQGDAAQGDAAHNARWYFSGLAASLLGNSAMSLVAGVWVKSLTGSSGQAGLVSACAYAATVGAPAAGLLADRLPRARWLLVINLVSAATMLPLLAVGSRAQTWIVFAVMAAYGVEATLNDPAEDALFAEMFSPEFRRRLVGRRLAIQETGRLAAPLLGAALFVVIGGGAVAALDAATFVIAALTITRLRVAPRVPRPARERLAAALGAGARHIWGVAELRAVAIAATAAMALSGAGVAAQYSLVAATGQRPAFLGVFNAILGAGSIVASLTAGRLIGRLGERWVAVIGAVDYAVGDLLRASGWLPGALAGTLVLGFALPYVFLAVLNFAQRATPNGLQGRVSGALTLALFGPVAATQALGSLLIEHASYVDIYVGSAVVSLAIAVALGAAGRDRRPRPTGAARDDPSAAHRLGPGR